ncbi:UNVERIFIED_CONTAM: hypothetical protein PYX00_008485 [Menopon gallinae]|uniref:RRM domain-containing protein n=1 Tax=Menopon gallinae TaxID=328185 RepID=A0AAW2HNK6_9NEOP
MMEHISLERSKQKKLRKKTEKIKKKIESGKIKISEKRKQKKKVPKNTSQRGAIYIGRIPHGFYEDELRSYFDQFGTVTRVKLARSKRTGRSKGYGFVEFFNSEVAKVAAEAMNNYLMFNCILKCRYIPPEEYSDKMFVRTVDEINFPRSKNRSINIRNKNKLRTMDEECFRRAKTEKKIEDFKKFFQDRGIEFNFKINDPAMSEEQIGSKTNGELHEGSESDVSNNSDSEDLTDDQFGVLEIDESDNEIQFKTPPQVKKVIKRYSAQKRITNRRA